MAFCEKCGSRYTKFDRYCPGCGLSLGDGPRVGIPGPEPSRPSGVTDWLEDLEVLPTDMEALKAPEKELPHAHLQTVRDGDDEKLQVVLDPDPDNDFPKPVKRREGPVEQRPEPFERGPEPVQQKQDSGWFMTPDTGTKPRTRTVERPRPDPVPDAVPEKPTKGGRNHMIHRAHGLEWQKEAQLKFEAEDGYHGPGPKGPEKIIEDDTEWTIPSGKTDRRTRRDDR